MRPPALTSLFAPVFLPTLATATFIQGITTRTDFKTLLHKHSLVFAAFTSGAYEPVAPFRRIFEQAAADVSTPFVLIDCDTEDALCREHDVNSYPTIRLFKTGVKREEEKGQSGNVESREREGEAGDGGKEGKEGANEDEQEGTIQWIRYRNPRTAHALKSFITKHELPFLTHISSPTSTIPLSTFREIDDVVMVAYLPPEEGSDSSLLDTLQHVATKRRNEMVFGYVTGGQGGVSPPAVVCYHNRDGDHKMLSGEPGEAELEALVDGADELMIGVFEERNMDGYLARDKLTTYIFIPPDDNFDTNAKLVRHALTPLARKYEKYVQFTVADAVEYSPLAQSLGLSSLPLKLPSLAVHAPINDNHFPYKQDRQIVPGVVEAMLMKILQGKASAGEMFGSDAPGTTEAREGEGHDEL